jgi:hypothetical protein
VVVLQKPADPDGRRHRIELHPDPLAREVVRLLDDPRIHRDEAVPEHARRKDRNRDERALPGHKPRHIFGGRHLGRVEAIARGDPIEQRARIMHRDVVEVDALGLDLAGRECGHPVVEAAAEAHPDIGHCGFLVPPIRWSTDRNLLRPGRAARRRSKRRRDRQAHPSGCSRRGWSRAGSARRPP